VLTVAFSTRGSQEWVYETSKKAHSNITTENRTVLIKKFLITKISGTISYSKFHNT